MKIIKLTSTTKDILYINPKVISSMLVCKKDKSTHIFEVNTDMESYWNVVETPEEIIDLINK